MHRRPATPPRSALIAPNILSTPPATSPQRNSGKRTRETYDGHELPATPKRRQPSELNELMRKIEKDWGICLLPLDEDFSPSKRRRACPEDQCRDLLQRLFWRKNSGLETCLGTYNQLVQEKTADTLLVMLKSQAQILGCVSSQIPSTSTSFASTIPTQPRTADTSFAETTNMSFTESFRGPESPSLVTDDMDDSLCTQDFLGLDLDTWMKGGTNVVEVPEPARKSLENYQIRDLPKKGLFVENLPISLQKASARLRYECVRLSLMYDVPIARFAERYNDTWETYGSFKLAVKSLLDKSGTPVLPTLDAWNQAGLESAFVLRSGQLSFQTVKTGVAGVIFNLSLDPLRLELTSCRFFRKFGAHRFLKLLVPSYRSLPSHLKHNVAEYQSRMQEWLSAPDKAFMGCKWSVFHVKADKSRRRKGAKGDGSEEGLIQLHLFATSGPGMLPVSLAELLDWFIPLEKNLDMTCCKAFARLELGLSMTQATIIFKPSEIQSGLNKFANGQAEDYTLDDQALEWHKYHNPKNRLVMNDGCARISQAAAQQVWLKLKGTGPCPSLFQARIGPWKGVWFLDEAPSPSGNGKIWLEVSPSQQKFINIDRDDNNFDVHRMTFEIVSWSRKPTTSNLYMDFLPILNDRGVSKSVLEVLVKNCLEEEQKVFEQAEENNAELLKWLEENCSISDGLIDGKGKIRGAMPMSHGGKLRRLLEVGFTAKEPTSESQYVQELLHQLLSAYFTRKSSFLDLIMPQSTFVYGVADPYGCLAPSEIHLGFSGIFGAEPYPYLHDCEVLVARHPTLRISDVQKVQATFKLELRHLVDVVVFPTTGSVPLASKLQGGDYDGDMFWLCWDKSITAHFRNAPMPHKQPRPEELGITVDATKLCDIVSVSTSRRKEQTVSKLFAKCFDFAWKPSMLGICTTYFNDLCYSSNMKASPVIDMYANLHDLLIDSSKNGYVFGDAEWNKFKNQHKDPSVKMKQVAHRKASEISLSTPTTYSKDNVVDHLIFKVARPHAQNYLQSRKPTSRRYTTDPALSCIHTLIYRGDDDIAKQVVKQVQKEVYEIFDKWKIGFVQLKDQASRVPDDVQSRHSTSYDGLIFDAYRKYRDLQPATEFRDCELVRGWLQHRLKHEPTQWERIKASTIAMLESRFAFDVAGPCLCYIKAYSNDSGPPRNVTTDIYRQMRIRHAPKRPVEHIDDENEVAQGDGDLEFRLSAMDHTEAEPEQSATKGLAPHGEAESQKRRKAGRRLPW